MVTKLVPKDMTGTAMGAWFLSFAGSNYVAGLIATLTGSEDGEGAEVATDAATSFATYSEVYATMGMVTVGIGVFLLLISGPLNKMMHGVR
jgi:POT family proton-dependent oligopeptide transporter